MRDGIFSGLGQEAESFRSALEKSLMSLPRDIPRYMEEALQYNLCDGKRLRSLLIFSAYKSASGSNVKEILDVCCAIEYMHAACLVLDDLPCMDDSQSRWGKKASHVRYGKAPTILFSVYLQNLGSNTLAYYENAEDLLRVVSEAMCLTVIGQAGDLAYLYDTDPHLKTYPLFSASALIGGWLAGAAEEEIELLGMIGEEIGRAYQTIDDILDLDIERERGIKIVRERLSNARMHLHSSSLDKGWLKSYMGGMERLMEEGNQ